MQANATDRPVDQVVAAIQALDLDPIKFKLMDREEGHGWSRAYADRMEIEYKRFLTLLATHPEETLAPTKDVDRFWHGHILDTLKYAEDCDRVFGHFLHHFPYFGMRGAEDTANLARAGEITQRLYEQEFGDGYERAASFPGINGSGPAYCAAIEASSQAYCAAINGSSPAYCAAIEASAPAYCAAIEASGAASRSAVTRDKLHVSLRPSL